MNALDLKGPEFLVWYLQSFALAGAAFFVLRWLLRRARDPALRVDLDTYEIAWLRDGTRGVVRAALTALHRARARQRLPGAGDGARPTSPRRGCPRSSAPCCERSTTGRSSRRRSSATSRRSAARSRLRLAKRGLALTPGWKALVCWVPLFGTLFCLWMGAIRLALGISNNRPVGLLLCLLAISVVLLVIAVRRRPHRTAAGDRKLKALVHRHAALRTTLETTVEPSRPMTRVWRSLCGEQAALGAVAFMSLSSLFDPRKAFGGERGADRRTVIGAAVAAAAAAAATAAAAVAAVVAAAAVAAAAAAGGGS